MADALLNMIETNVDYESLTAEPGDVFDRKTFVGKGSETVQTGTGTTRGAPNHILPVNGRIVLPEGKYTGGKVYQSIPVLGEQRINPTSKNITIPTKDKYMGGNIILNPIANLRPENIKLGEYIGGVGPGTWEGYINDDPNTFYLYGTFAPGQSITAIRYSQSGKPGTIEVGKKDLRYVVLGSSTSDYPKSIYGRFDRSIDITTKNKIIIEMSTYAKTRAISVNVYGYTVNGSVFNELGEENLIFQKQLIANSPVGEVSNRQIEVDISPYSRSVYLYVYAHVGDVGDYFALRKLKFE